MYYSTLWNTLETLTDGHWVSQAVTHILWNLPKGQFEYYYAPVQNWSLPSGLVPLVFPLNVVYSFLLTATYAVFPTCVILIDIFILKFYGVHRIMHHISYSSILLLLSVSHIQIVICSENGTCVPSLKWDRMTVTGKIVVHLHSDVNLLSFCIFTCLS